VIDVLHKEILLRDREVERFIISYQAVLHESFDELRNDADEGATSFLMLMQWCETLECFECHDKQHRDSRVGLDAPAALVPHGSAWLCMSPCALPGIFSNTATPARRQ